MSEAVQAELYRFLIYIYGGLVFGILYDLYRTIRWMIRPGKWATLIEDAIWVFISFGILLYLSFHISDGHIRLYNFIGIGLGILVYFLVLSRIILKLFRKIFRGIRWITKKIIIIIAYPIKVVIKFIKKLGKLLYKPILWIKGLFVKKPKP